MFEKSFRRPKSILKSEFIARNLFYAKGCFRHQNYSITNFKTNKQTII